MEQHQIAGGIASISPQRQPLDFIFKECFQTLKPGGAFFFSVPGAEPFLRADAERLLQSRPSMKKRVAVSGRLVREKG